MWMYLNVFKCFPVVGYSDYIHFLLLKINMYILQLSLWLWSWLCSQDRAQDADFLGSKDIALLKWCVCL